jgi:hypothetical protein
LQPGKGVMAPAPTGCRQPGAAFASGGKKWRRLGDRAGQHFSLYGKEEPAHLVSGCRPVPAGPDNEIKQLGRLGPPERGSSLAMQIIELGGNFSDQEYLTINRECTHFFWGHLPNHETDATNQPLLNKQWRSREGGNGTLTALTVERLHAVVGDERTR